VNSIPSDPLTDENFAAIYRGLAKGLLNQNASGVSVRFYVCRCPVFGVYIALA